MSPFTDPLILDILAKYRPIAAMTYSQSLLGWDMETQMPEAGATARGFVQAELELFKQKMTLDLANLVSQAEKQRTLNETEKGVVRVFKRELDFYQKVPAHLLEELQKATNEAAIPWRHAREKSDFNTFKPHLERITELKRKQAEYLNPSTHPYNALLDLSEEGLTTTDLDRIFGEMIPKLKTILGKTVAGGRFPEKHPLEEMDYDVPALKKVNETLLRLLDMPSKRFRQDVSTHPFSTRIGGDDVRITTRYEPKDFRASMFGLIHECGHALYELQVDHALDFTPTGGGVSSGLHESQSRFWENIVGRSKHFTPLVYPLLKDNLDILDGYSEDEVYSYFNTVRPSLIRVEADELTYNFHIAMRYELEKKLLEGKINVSELPSVWNDMIEEYLGKRPPDDAQGVLQDIHWSWGQYATFPSYSLGNVIAGMLWNTLTKKGLLPVKDAKSLAALKHWLAENIHKPGATYPPKELLSRVFNKGYDPSGLISYLENKYLMNS
ncbi:MAG TPA: carboxypeptidase M32 [Candidatus Dormibacteraeota bacterium]|jgi:carboxypeptidase Taq|nr:carboxypeptidase M32 [Candidatus Dormibacteraeota bacterium]